MNSYCSIPWVHLRLDPSGKNGLTGVSPCCKFYYEEWQTINPDNSVTDGILNSLNTPAFQGIRQDMLRGNSIKGCQNCYSDEAAGLESMRTQANSTWKLNDLSTDYLHTKFIEVSLDNTCNLECKMCSSYFSSKLRKRDELLGPVSYTHLTLPTN